jgi:hypothetical protein
MNEEQRKRLQKEIIKENFHITHDNNYNAVYHPLIPGMEKETRYSKHECLDLIKSRPEILDRSIGKYLDEKEGIYVYKGRRYSRNEMIRAIFNSNNARGRQEKIKPFGES